MWGNALAPLEEGDSLAGTLSGSPHCHHMAKHQARQRVTDLGSLSSRPWVFLIVPLYGVLWFIFERETFDWHGIATLATWLMTLFIQRSEHRDTQAIHAKLDELLHAQHDADDSMTRIDDAEPEEIEAGRERHRQGD